MWHLAVLVALATAASVDHTLTSFLQINSGIEAGVAVKELDVSRGAVQKSVANLKKTYPFFHTSQEIRHEIHRLSEKCGGAMTVKTLSDSEAPSVHIDFVRIRAPKSNPVNRVFILFGEHSRELIGPESGLRLLEVICGSRAMDGDVKVESVLQDSEFHIVINGNPRSRTLVEQGEYCLRTNPNGVDLNRNWDERWVEQHSNGPDDNPGAFPFSEPETRIFMKLAKEIKPTTFLTVHSGTKGLYMPWAYDTTHLAHYNRPRMLEVLKHLDEKHCECPYGAAGKEVGYSCPGTCLDWVYSKLNTPYVFAFEIYTSPDRDADLKQRWDATVKNGGLKLLQSGSHLGHRHFANVFADFASDFVQTSNDEERTVLAPEDCFDTFNPPTEELYNKTVQNWAAAYLEMAAQVAKDIKYTVANSNGNSSE